jgi:hypothetical protein
MRLMNAFPSRSLGGGDTARMEHTEIGTAHNSNMGYIQVEGTTWYCDWTFCWTSMLRQCCSRSFCVNHRMIVSCSALRPLVSSYVQTPASQTLECRNRSVGQEPIGSAADSLECRKYGHQLIMQPDGSIRKAAGQFCKACCDAIAFVPHTWHDFSSTQPKKKWLPQ